LAPFVGQVELLTAIPGSTTASRRSSSPASAPTWPPFPPQGTWRRGLGCAWANATRPADTARARPATGPRGLRGALVQCASAPARLTRQGRLLSLRYRQVVRRRSDAKAIVYSGYQILLAAYRVLVPAQPFKDPGPTTLSRLTAQRLTHQAVVHIATCTDAA
jgi:hypothetical protein